MKSILMRCWLVLCETHYQRGYTLEEMENFVKQAGMKVELILDADTRKAPDFKSERIYIVAREKGKVSKEA